MKIKLGSKILVLFFIGLSNIVNAQDGSLDLSFSGDGMSTIAFGSEGDEASSVAIQQDGKIVVVGFTETGGNADFAIARFNSDGTLDNTFSGDGKQTVAFGSFSDIGKSVAIQNDGKIVVAGFSNNGTNNDFAVARLNIDGTLDNTFSGDGKLTTPIGTGQDYAWSLAIQSDGKIVVAGAAGTDIAVVRYNTDGTLDTSFNLTGIQTTDFGAIDIGYSIAIQGDGKIVVAGSKTDGGVTDDFAVVRYNSDGTYDNTFSGDGMLTTNFLGVDRANSLDIQQDGKIVVAGMTENNSIVYFALARYNSDGTLDNSFSGDGKQTTGFGSSAQAHSVVIQPDGKILAAGAADNNTPTDFILVRYNSDGSLDNTFSGDGIQTTDFGSTYDRGYSMAIQSDLKIVVVGLSGNGLVSDFAVARYNTTNIPTGVFDLENSELKIYPNPISTQSTFQTNKFLTTATLTVYNSFGQAVKEINNITGQTVTIFRDNLPSGLYFFRLTEGSKIIKAGSLVITD